MSDTQTEPSPSRKRMGWVKRTSVALLVLAILAGIFHRPLFFEGTRYFLIRAAKKQNLHLEYEISGSIFTGLHIRNFSATPDGRGPVEKLNIERIELGYSLPGLIRKGLPGFLDRLVILNADIELNPAEKVPKPKRQRKAFKFPALFPREVWIENFNLVSHQKKGDLVVRELDLILDPAKPGRFSVAELTVPSFRTWENLEAATVYPERNLVIKNLALDSIVQLALLNLNASELEKGILGIVLTATAFGGEFELDARIEDLNRANTVRAVGALLSIPIAEAAEYFEIETRLAGNLREASFEIRGPLDIPAEWSGAVALDIEQLEAGETTFESVALTADAREGALDLEAALELTEGNRLKLAVTGRLPEALDDLPSSDLAGRLDVDFMTLADASIPGIYQGSATGFAHFTISDRKLSADVRLEANGLIGRKLTVGNGRIDAQLSKPLDLDAEDPPYKGLSYRAGIEGSDIQTHGIMADRLTAAIEGRGDQVIIESLDVRRGENRISASGEATLPAKGRALAGVPLKFTAEIEAPQLAQFTTPEAALNLAGTLSGQLEGSRSEGKWAGSIVVTGSDVSFRNVTAESLDIDGTVEDNLIDFRRINVRLNENNFVRGSLELGLDKPHAYRADIEAQLPDLALLEPVLEKDGKRPRLGGAASLRWKGEGSLSDFENDGTLDLQVEDARFGEVTNIDARITGTLGERVIEIPGLEFSSSVGTLKGDVRIAEDQLHITNLELMVPEKVSATGSVTLPIDLSQMGKLEKMFPADGAVRADMELRELALGTLLRKDDEAPPVTGNVAASLSADGTLANPDARLRLEATELRFKAVPDLAPATLTASATLDAGRLNVDSEFRMPEINPLSISASVPLSIPEILKNKEIDTSAPIQGQIVLPSSGVGWITRASPEVRYIEGRIAVNAQVDGTIEKPELSGSLALDLPALRFRNQNVPPISGVTARVGFSQSRLRIEQFSGALAGGPFSASGEILLEPLTRPQFDIRLITRNALLVRNETLTVRANSNLSIKGEVNAATVSGVVAITNSRFFREIDILPLELPGRPAPKPPETAPGFSITKGPLKDWQFDVKIVTADPFLIRGNLADGSIVLDMRLVGSGEFPALDGYARIKDLSASLPFSRLDVTTGYAYFSPGNPFMPELDIHGRSELRNYRINVYIYGAATAPQTLFTSQPPLPQEDIISLLATGTTTEELTGNSEALAGRAAVLLWQKLSRTWFKGQERPEEGSFLDRLEFDVGSIDPKTGRQEVEARFELTDHFYLIGDLDIEGDVRGQVKYLLRFR